MTGILIGPGGFGLVRDPSVVHTLAEFGVVLLLFTVGLEFSFADLKRLGRRALVGGALQVAAHRRRWWPPALVLAAGTRRGRCSSACWSRSRARPLVLKLLTDRIELRSPHGRLATGVLLFQDLAAVPLPAVGRAARPLGRAASASPWSS